MILFTGPASAQIKYPEWKEFCPEEYLNIEYIKDNTMPEWKYKLCVLSIIGIPYAIFDLSRYNKIKENNYWYDLKKQFNNEVESCKQISDNNYQIMCFLEIRKHESHKNDIKNGLYKPVVRVKNINTNNNYHYGY